ncbi:hypothetical protein QYM36_017981 [Artemia franciscana]|uniref:Uncharacterized protein n=1 Tax=Artemia franciscana TaxID=6661 RepID=A0AA88H394_ARTSF|nr:hypothetical protein QYM36_017981 [Artemia franciscana]
MNQLSKTEQVLKEMRQYLIDILVLSEIRWTGNGLEKFSDGYVMAFSGHPSVHRAGAQCPVSGKEITQLLEEDKEDKDAQAGSSDGKDDSVEAKDLELSDRSKEDSGLPLRL